MPIYEYRCTTCDHRFEILQRLGEGAEGISCPNCGADRLAKQYSTFASATHEVSSGAQPMAGGCCRGTPT